MGINMAFGRGSRNDNRRGSSFCSTTTIIVFVALCLVGVWMMTSSTMSTVALSSVTTKSKLKEKFPVTNPEPFEDSSINTIGDSATGFTNENEGALPAKSDSASERITGKVVEKSDENSAEENTAAKDDSGDTSKDKKKTEADDKRPEPVNEEKAEQEQKSGGENQEEKSEVLVEEKAGETGIKNVELSSEEKKDVNQSKDKNESEVFPSGTQSELLNETNSQNGAWSTQAAESKNEIAVQSSSSSKDQPMDYSWKLCNVTTGADYIPCLDNVEAIKKLHSTKHYEHRERHCPEDAPTCLVSLPDGYTRPIKWPKNRDMIWYNNVPHTKLAAVKGHQNWVKVSGNYLTFPGGGTQFKHGALHYIDFIQETLQDIGWGRRSRVILDVGCGVASFGGYLFDQDVLTMSFAPKDEHEAQVQFALERGIPAISAVMGTKRLPFPSNVFDVVHCARCRVPWHIEGGMLLLELSRMLRPGGYFVWSATPIYQDLPEDVGIWKAMSELTKSMCWKMVAKQYDTTNQVGVAIYRKPTNNKCYESRAENSPPLCQESDDPDAAWNIPLQSCMHKLPVNSASRGRYWPEEWPQRLHKTPYWLNGSEIGIYGKPAPEDFDADYDHWRRVLRNSYINGLGINWSTVRNVMDMRSVYGGFAAALRDMNVWVMNVVSVDAPDTLPIIFERGLFGIYHDWCESFNTYPRTYDLLHTDHLFSRLKKRCKLLPVIAEVDRILRPEGKLIVRDTVETITEIENIARSLHWEIRMRYSQENEGLLCIQKTMWRPTEVQTTMSSTS